MSNTARTLTPEAAEIRGLIARRDALTAHQREWFEAAIEDGATMAAAVRWAETKPENGRFRTPRVVEPTNTPDETDPF